MSTAPADGCTRTPPGRTCPPWCARTAPHGLHTLQAGHTGGLWVAAAQDPTWCQPRIVVSHDGERGDAMASVLLPLTDAPDLAVILRRLGHGDAAALVDAAITAVTAPDTPGHETGHPGGHGSGHGVQS